MSKKSKKAKGKSRSVSAQESSVVAASKVPSAEARDLVRDAAVPAPASTKSAFPSLAPSTQDIDDDWGAEDETKESSPAPVLVQPRTIAPASTVPRPSVAQTTQGQAPVTPSTRAPALLRPSVAPRVSSVPPSSSVPRPLSSAPVSASLGKVTPSAARSSTPPPSRRVTTPSSTTQVHAPVGPPSAARSSTPPPSRRLTPAVGTPVVANVDSPTAVDVASAIAPVIDRPSTRPPPPVHRSLTPLTGTPIVLDPIVAPKPAELAPLIQFDEPPATSPLSIPAVVSAPLTVVASNRRLRGVLAALWVVTAAVPAVAVWLVMRTPRPVAPALVARQAIESPVLAQEPVNLPALASAEPVTTAVSTAVPEEGALAAASAIPVVVASDAGERVSVLVASRPKGARVYRLGKEIGKTPVTIEIGRGEHRIFEVGAPGYATRRVSLDGDKTEVLVKLALQLKAETVQASAP